MKGSRFDFPPHGAHKAAAFCQQQRELCPGRDLLTSGDNTTAESTDSTKDELDRL